MSFTEELMSTHYDQALSLRKQGFTYRAIGATTTQRDGSFGLYMPKAYQKNRPFGLVTFGLWFEAVA